jgi:hypothetical protein
MMYATSDKRFTVKNDQFNIQAFVVLCEFNGNVLNRAELTELRHIIDQALNTSAEELGDA